MPEWKENEQKADTQCFDVWYHRTGISFFPQPKMYSRSINYCKQFSSHLVHVGIYLFPSKSAGVTFLWQHCRSWGHFKWKKTPFLKPISSIWTCFQIVAHLKRKKNQTTTNNKNKILVLKRFLKNQKIKLKSLVHVTFTCLV